MLRILKGSARAIIIPVFITLIGCASSTIGVFEEMFPFIPIFVGIAIAMGYDAIVGLAIVALGTGLGYSGCRHEPVYGRHGAEYCRCPADVGRRLPDYLSYQFLIAVASFFVVRYALKIQADPTKSLVYGDDFSSLAMDSDHIENKPFGIGEKLVVATLVAGIVVIVWGTKAKGLVFCGTERSIPFDGTRKRFHYGLGTE